MGQTRDAEEAKHLRQRVEELERALQEERARSQRLRSFIDHAPVAIFLANRQGEYVEVNPAACRLMGWSRQELLGRSLRELIYVEDIQIASDHFQQVVRDGRALGELRYVRASGQVRWWRVEAVRLSEDHFMAFCQDTTAHRAIETSLRESEARFRALFESAGVGFAIVDAEGRVVEVNPYFSTLLGYGPEEAQGLDLLEITHPEDRPSVEQSVHELRQGLRHTYYSEHRLRSAGGDQVWVSMSTSAVRDPQGQLLYGMHVLRDIDRRKRAEDERALLQDQVLQSQRLESVGRLAGGVAHDFNNLLSPILAYGEMLVADLGPWDPRLEDAQEIVDAAQRGRHLTRQLLAFSRRQVIEARSHDLNAVVDGFERLLRRTLREDIQLQLQLCSHPLSVLCDPGQVEQVIMNLAVNAQDAMPEGGRLVLRTEQRFEGQPETMTDPASAAVLVVEDSGHGMLPEVMERIFEPFFTTKARGKGTGLGLSTAYGIMRQHGGHLEVEPREGGGTRFLCWLPLVDERVHSTEETASLPLGGQETILVVEDEGPVRRALAMLLRRLGYAVLEASDGQEVFERLSPALGQVDLLLTDVIMPRMGGTELARRLTERRPELGVLYLSGYSQDELQGAVDVEILQKPVNQRVLAHRVRAILDRQRASVT